MLHKEILSAAQLELLPLIKQIGSKFMLCGGTAVALHIGHRESIDFDLFTLDELNIDAIRKKLAVTDRNFSVLVKNEDEYTVAVKGIKITFLQYPFPLEPKDRLDDVVQVPDLLTLAATKAYTLGRRSKWKDYIDLYFILSQFYSLKEVAEKARKILPSFPENENFPES